MLCERDGKVPKKNKATEGKEHCRQNGQHNRSQDVNRLLGEINVSFIMCFVFIL